ncbi:uncharacterized [Tachysurus ichikawai]
MSVTPETAAARAHGRRTSSRSSRSEAAETLSGTAGISLPVLFSLPEDLTVLLVRSDGENVTARKLRFPASDPRGAEIPPGEPNEAAISP